MMRRLTAMPRGVAVFLLASLCLNVLLAAYIGTQWAERLRMPLVAAAPTRLMEMIARRLPSADQDALWRVYRSKESEMSEAHAAYRKALAVAADEFARRDLDLEAVRKAVGGARDARLKVGDLTIGVIIEALPQISREGRLDLIGPLRKQ